MPQDGTGDRREHRAHAERGGPPCWSVACRMSGVFTQKFGRNQSTSSVCDNSVRYWPSSQALLRHVKYVYDCVKPILASRCITAGRVNASASMTHVRVLAADLGDQPLPEGERLGVRVVDAEDPHPVADPEAHHVPAAPPRDAARRRVSKSIG